MAEAVPAKVLGPQPRKGIVVSWQGRVEILFRFLAAVIAALPALVAAAVAVGTANLDANVSAAIRMGDTELEALQRETFGSAGWVIGVAGLAFLVQVFMLVLRFCNIGLINLKINIFLTMDIILSLFFALGLGAGGSAMAVFARDWTDFDQPGFTYNARQIRDSLAAGAAFSLLGLILFGFLSVWVFFCMMINRNKVEYTIRMDVASEPAQELVVQAPP